MPCAFARMEPSLLSVGRSRPTEVKIRETEGGELQLQGEEGREEKRERDAIINGAPLVPLY